MPLKSDQYRDLPAWRYLLHIATWVPFFALFFLPLAVQRLAGMSADGTSALWVLWWIFWVAVIWDSCKWRWLKRLRLPG